jgi:hypothetical protein
MAGYLEEYGVSDERRSKVIRWIVISAVVAAVTATASYFTLRTYPAKHQVKVFLADLERHDYRTAYRDWGCGAGCPDYKYESFMQDWGPQSPFANAADARIRKSRFCETGVIVTLTPVKGDDVALWYERSAGTLGFAPWPVCAPRIPAPTAAPAP